MQPQRPGRLDTVEIDKCPLLQHREIAALGNFAHHTPQHGAPLGGGGIVAQQNEREAREPLADDIGATAGLAGEKAGLLE